MKKKVLIVLAIAVFALIFVLAGIPSLRYLKEHKPSILFKIPSGNSTAPDIAREVTIDISIEDICLNPVTGEAELECSSSAACQMTCKNKGCVLFGLNYLGSEFKGSRCYCNCYEENKIKKVLNIEEYDNG
jgi:hypothetical protein